MPFVVYLVPVQVLVHLVVCLIFCCLSMFCMSRIIFDPYSLPYGNSHTDKPIALQRLWCEPSGGEITETAQWPEVTGRSRPDHRICQWYCKKTACFVTCSIICTSLTSLTSSYQSDRLLPQQGSVPATRISCHPFGTKTKFCRSVWGCLVMGAL